jgi:hypothetical protein
MAKRLGSHPDVHARRGAASLRLARGDMKAMRRAIAGGRCGEALKRLTEISFEVGYGHASAEATGRRRGGRGSGKLWRMAEHLYLTSCVKNRK